MTKTIKNVTLSKGKAGVIMRNTAKRILLFIIVTAATGCTLEAARDVGDKCDGLSYTYFGRTGQRIEIGENADYDVFMKAGYCPPNAPYCMTLVDEKRVGETDENGIYLGDEGLDTQWYCSDRMESCENGAHPWKKDNVTVCELDSAAHCGAHEINCQDSQKGVLDATCIQGKSGKECHVDHCLPGFALINGECVTGDHCCGTYCKNCSLSDTSDTVCYTLDYENYDCGSGCPLEEMIQCNGVCVNPLTSLVYCGATENYDAKGNADGTCDIHYCADNVGWRRGDCIDGICRVRECLSGYHMSMGSDGINVCTPDTPEACGSDEVDCSQIPHQSKVTCRRGRCDVLSCESGYFPYDGMCVDVNGEHCGAIDIICGVNQHCDAETNQCKCNHGFEECDGYCYDLTSSERHCGSCETECSTANADNRCENAHCAFTCKDGFIEVDNRCEPRICEENEIRCIEASIEVCRNNAWSPLSSCPQTTVANAHAVCKGNDACDWACNKGFARCEENGIEACYELSSDAAHCGQCEVSCAVDFAENRCEDGVCSFECILGYTLNADETGCEETVCEDGATACTNETTTGMIKTCTRNRWGDAEPCPSNASCMDAYSCGECIDGNKRCADSQRQQRCHHHTYRSYP